MAELYIILHCYENSARRLIETVLSTSLGATWWEKAANTGMKAKYQDRRQKEQRQKWITPRGGSPLYYIDWGDLVALIRKHENEFLPFISDIKFVELRLEELERLRNIVAHHGVLPAEDDFQRVILSFRDWCRQVNP
ncbi:Abi family protein [Gemmatirosa kalamazoonensis]|uniref:Abi family protein n=2 Tax=Gemmatirosa kalamazoonensis TaxID=861299 RepID=W0RLI9_9BACT|nr:Abi family protein [Gemmatirosa kalamazoonensis]